MLTIIFDESATAFSADYHPERPARLTMTQTYLCDQHPDWAWLLPRLASEEEVLRVHRPEHLERLRLPVDFDPDTPFYPEIEEHALRAAGAAIESVDLALRGQQAFSLMRPPGHHATSTRAMGFCYLNSIAIAAFHALEEAGCERVGILDFDAHHGNGTEAIVFGNNRVRFVSIHQHPCYPGTGTASRGNVLNWPIPPRSPAERHAAAVHQALDRLVEFRPDLVLVSAGFDAYVRDPLTEMTLEAEHFASFGRWLRETGLPVAPILEGGYSNELPILIEAFLTAWSD
ncbi:MAG: histone deacetylase [Verrucomicrobia bacterium]|nr:histone deacetylase [Verrucomicrobiota bacterium]MBV8378831.1 histone deacetylase [Verrucomicrobiota bacterium]